MTPSTKARELAISLGYEDSYLPEKNQEFYRVTRIIDKYLAAARREGLEMAAQFIEDEHNQEVAVLSVSCPSILSDAIRSLIPTSSDGEGL